jgi:nucleoside-diphosphate-sugar epimerase
MRVLVTGCAGFIGSHLTERLLHDGHAVLGIDCFNENYGRAQKLHNLRQFSDWVDFEFAPIDLARGELHDLVAECDVVYHLAAEPGVRASWGSRFEAYVRNNILATQHLLEAARDVDVQRFVYASSSSIYGQAARLPTSEDVTPRPYSPYGVTKLGGEHLCELYQANHGVPTVQLRYFTVYGPKQRPDMAFHIFCKALLRNEPIRILGDGEQTREFTFVRDIVDATIAAARQPGVEGRVYNVGGGSRVTLAEALRALEEISGSSFAVEYHASQAGDVQDTGASIERARRELGYAPSMSLREGLELEFEWMANTLELLP